MSGDVAVEAVRPRPLSGGLWTLFSWLRRDERSRSSESLSSAGSDRTAASFAFLGPGHYVTADPLAIAPPGPPTDSYKKRVRDRNLRRNRDRDVTLLRKYGLHGFDAFTLPNVRLAGSRGERDRRATSEVLQRRAHVPGKRRAPPPPSAPATLTRRRARKRPAPQPPVNKPITEEDKIETESDNTETLPMNSERIPDKPLKHSEVTMGCKSEKYIKKEASTKEVKHRLDKSFLKHIFENRKRHSAIDTTSVKLLPSISELDKQAHEIIEKYKLKELEHTSQGGRIDNNSPAGSSKQQTEAWICTRCLRKYNASVITCLYCLPLENALLNNSSKNSKVTNYTQTTSHNNRSSVEDKEKLKEILKEMKDNLPKIPSAFNEDEDKINSPKIVEAPTLRIGSSVSAAIKSAQPASSTRKVESEKQMSHNENKNDKSLATIENVLVTQPVVLVHTKDNIVIVDHDKDFQRQQLKPLNVKTKKNENSNLTKTQIASKLLSDGKNAVSVSSNDKKDINTPLKISSLLNPIYIPKPTASINITKSSKQQQTTQNEGAQPVISQSNANLALLSTSNAQDILSNVFKSEENTKHEDVKQSSSKGNDTNVKEIEDTKPSVTKVAVRSIATSSNPSIKTGVVEMIDQHSRRRNLINQLEKSIAEGDERAAADAAVKLAQLKLSCSVLSFSSQIASEPSTSGAGKIDDHKTDETSKTSQTKENAAPVVTPVQSKETSPKKDTSDNNLNRSNQIVKVPDKRQENINQIKVPPLLNEAPPPATTTAAPKVGPVINKLQHEKINKAVQNPVRCDPSTSTSKDNAKKDNNEDVPILVWVEDKEATRGPVQIHVGRNATLGDLRRQADASLGLAVPMQRWIIGRALCSDDNTPLVSLAGPELTAPFYLCLVESETKKPEEPQNTVKLDAGNVYNELVKLEQKALVPNAETFECGVCMEECLPGGGVVLRDCVHSFCNECLSDVVRHSQEPDVSCPAMGCRGVLQEREIRALVSGEDYEKWLARGLAMAESGTRHSFHCRTRDCTGWALCEPGVRRFPCPVCKRNNCVPCQAIHEGKTCEQHRADLQAPTANEANQTDEGTRALLDSLIARGEALECPECSAIITKKWGCDWIKCSACKTEICWVTRGRRWGPAGRGDTSAGCRCGVDGKKCHPSCGYCH